MSDEFDAGLRAYLADRERLAAQATSPGRVLARVDTQLAERTPAARRWRGTPVLGGLAIAAVMAAVIAGTLGLRPHLGTPPAPAGPTRPWVHGAVPATPPPPGVPVTYVQDPAQATRLIAFDWSGQPVGSITLPLHPHSAAPVSWIASPDGSRLVVQSQDGTSEDVVTAQGQHIGSLPVPPGSTPGDWQTYPTRFADDNRTICQERDASTPADTASRTLWVISGGGAARTIAEAPRDAPQGLRWALDACSVRNDLAVFTAAHYEPPQVTTSTPAPPSFTAGPGLARGVISGPSVTIHEYPQWVVMLRIVRLSTGAELSRHTYTNGTVGHVEVAPDGSAVAEDPAADGPVHVRDLRTGLLSATPIAAQVVFTGVPGHVVAVDDLRDSHGNNSTDLALLDWRTGQQLWHRVLGAWSPAWTSQPGGDTVRVHQELIRRTCSAFEDDALVTPTGDLVPLTRGPDRCAGH